MVAGKGHENYQEYFNKRFFSDSECIIKNIKHRNNKLLNDWKLNIVAEKTKQKIFKKNQKINLASINSKDVKKNDVFFELKEKK